MKVLVYSANFAPEPTGIGKYSGEMAAWLAEQGHSVRVVCAPPYYPAWKVDPAYVSPAFRREQWNGVDVWRAPLWIPKSPGGVARVLHLLSFAITSFPLMVQQVFWRPDLVVCIAPALVCAPTGLLTARLCRAKAWLHLQDFEVDVAFGMGLLKGRLLQRIVLRMERTFLRRFDAVSSISNRMVELLLSKGVSQERTRYFPNWVDTSNFKPAATGQAFRSELNIAPEAVVAVFSGTLSGKQGLMVIPSAAKLLAHRSDITFVICGDGLLKAELEAATLGMSNVRHLPLQPLARLGELFSMADVHLLPQNPEAADLVLPSKLSGMLASGRPVIATCRQGTEIEKVVMDCGLVVPPEDSVALAAAICQLADDAVVRGELGKRARAYAQANFERNTVLKRFFEPLDGEPGVLANDDLVA